MLRASDLVHLVIRRQLRQRSYGSILSVCIGIGVYLLVAVLGRDIEERVSRDMSLVGAVSTVLATFEEHMHPHTPPQTFAPETVARLRQMPEVLQASVYMRWACWVPMQDQQRRFTLFVLGVDPWFWEANDLSAAEGRLLNQQDEAARARVCVLGEEMAVMLFGEGPCLGRIITILNDNYMVVGIGRGARMPGNGTWCMIPLSTAIDRGIHDAGANRLLLRLRNLKDVAPMAEKLPGLVAAQQQALYLKVEYAREELARIQNIISMVHILLLLGILGSLALGCLGIWQGAFASVRERTKEIGLQLVMGAERGDIVLQILMEALCKALLGGLAGIVLGGVVIAVCSVFLAIPADWNSFFRTVPLCLASAALVGASGGLYPAIRAGRMDVVTALRYE